MIGTDRFGILNINTTLSETLRNELLSPMKRKIYMLAIALFCSLATGCSEGCIETDPPKTTPEEVSGEKLPISYLDVPPFWDELGSISKIGMLFVIRDQEELNTKLNGMVPKDRIPVVDFSKNSVLMMLGSGVSSPFVDASCVLTRITELLYVLDNKVQLGWHDTPCNWGTIILTPVIPENVKIAVYTGYEDYP